MSDMPCVSLSAQLVLSYDLVNWQKASIFQKGKITPQNHSFCLFSKFRIFPRFYWLAKSQVFLTFWLIQNNLFQHVVKYK